MPSKEQIISVTNLPINIEKGGIYSIMQSNPNSYTHGMFKYPCKFIPEIPRWAINKYLHGRQGVIFDPFSGSGTTLLEANINGYSAWGTEIDDIAKLIISVKTTKISERKLGKLDEIYREITQEMLNETATSYRPLINNLEHWFGEETILKLGKIKNHVETIDDLEIKNFFKLCFVSIVKRVSKADDTSPKPYVSNKIIKNPPAVEREFASVYRRYKEMLIGLSSLERLGTSIIITGDALSFDLNQGIDLAITSPPYINAFDYGRTMRLENLWLGTLTENELRNKKKNYVGTEKISAKKEIKDLKILGRSQLLENYYNQIVEIDEKRALIVKKFFEDMETNLHLIYSQLNVGGKYMIVIGDSMIRNVEVESWKVLEELGNNIGFITADYYSYVIQNPYIRIPRNGKGGKINKDYVLVMEKGE